MKRSYVLASRFSIHLVMSKFFTSPANLVANCEQSNCVMGPMPLCPRTRPCQVSSVPMPSGVARPIPVTTTRLFCMCFYVINRVLDGLDLLGVLVRDLDLERFFEREHELDDRQRIGLEVLGERGRALHLLGRDLELLRDDLFDSG